VAALLSAPEPPEPMLLTIRRVLLVLALWDVCGAAYIDPGATSLVWQLIVSGVIGAGFTLRSRIASLIRRFRYRNRDETKVPRERESDSS
jgi:hypothetical protein